MIQKHCFECGTSLIEKELEGEGIVPYCPKCEQYRFPMYSGCEHDCNKRAERGNTTD